MVEDRVGPGFPCSWLQLAPGRGDDRDCPPGQPSSLGQQSLSKGPGHPTGLGPSGLPWHSSLLSEPGLPGAGPGPLGVQRARYPVSPGAAPALSVSCDLN